MSATTLILRPHDTLFLRDGRPFNAGDQEQAAAGIFPPWPPTVAGALRAALARAHGWTGGPWPVALQAALGDGVDWSQGDAPLGPLRFTGPFVLQDEKPLFPAPLCLLVKRSGEIFEKVVRLAPGAPLDCDLGRGISLPEKLQPLDGGKTPEEVWIDAAGLRAVLDGEELSVGSLIAADALWKTESRVGIARDPQTGTTQEGALYAAAHVRLRARVSLGVSLDGADAAGITGKLVPMGGEGRGVWVAAGAKITLPEAAAQAPGPDGVVRYTVVLLTPAYFGDAPGDWPQPGGTIECGDGRQMPGRIVSACVGKPVPVGGWDGEARAPLPLRPLAPAGSVWFLEAGAGDVTALQDRDAKKIGRATGWGFGLAAIGRW